MKMPTERIREEISQSGLISFARFMELALYCPETGYYEKKKDNVGRQGDFITSVSVGSLFGELLAFQFAEWLTNLPGERIQIVEAGAHDGKLATDVLCWLAKHRPTLFQRVEYVILEPSARRRVWQEEHLREFGQKVRWLDTTLESHVSEFNGIVFANELLDALPVRRIGWSAAKRNWFEWGVTSAAEKLIGEDDAVEF